jgi:hypothetical protein
MPGFSLPLEKALTKKTWDSGSCVGRFQEGRLGKLSFVRQDAGGGEGVMRIRHEVFNARWDHFWNQRVHFHALLVITHDDFDQ